MPTGVNGTAADTSYEEEGTMQTITDSQQRSQGGTYLPHGTTLVGGGSEIRATTEGGAGENTKAKPAFVENVDTPNVTVERAEAI
jgi:hypothetical protein